MDKVSLDNRCPFFIAGIAIDSLRSETSIMIVLKHATFSQDLFFFLLNEEEAI